MTKRTQSTKAGDVYREAARAIAENEEEYSCCAVARACRRYDAWNEGRYSPPRLSKYVNIYQTGCEDLGLQSAIETDGDYKDARGLRVLLLCFAAAMADAGDL